MKKIIFMLLFLASFLTADDNRRSSGNLKVIINGFENDEGSVRVALSNSQQDYEATDSTYKGVVSKIKNRTAVILFNQIPFGEYAVKVFHDRDDDGELDTNFLGIPSEEYGFSNNAPSRFGPASWEDARFEFNAVMDSIAIRIE